MNRGGGMGEGLQMQFNASLAPFDMVAVDVWGCTPYMAARKGEIGRSNILPEWPVVPTAAKEMWHSRMAAMI